jgi:ubiquinol-cytochrome c reductase cytochrome c1 subunit
VTDGPDDFGQMFERPALPFDPIPKPFPNDQAARAANNGALPVDLSLITKARVGGPDYVHALLIGYREPPPDSELGPNMYYNQYFPGHQIAMPPPLAADQVQYADGTPATVQQMAHDVVSFLSWAAEPTLEERHRMGFRVMLFLIVGAGIFYAVKRKIWSRIQH